MGKIRDICGTKPGYHKHYLLKETPCPECHEALSQWWKSRRETHKDQINSFRRSWRDRTPNAHRGRMRRAKANGGELGYYSDEQVLELYGTNCHICEESIDFDAPRQCGKDGWEKGFHVDHVIPLSRGGADTIENVRPSHGQCNIIKWATYLDK